ncbi:hypothetical protein LINPERHAP2_LOCUS28114 [Linum perenne]
MLQTLQLYPMDGTEIGLNWKRFQHETLWIRQLSGRMMTKNSAASASSQPSLCTSAASGAETHGLSIQVDDTGPCNSKLNAATGNPHLFRVFVAQIEKGAEDRCQRSDSQNCSVNTTV